MEPGELQDFAQSLRERYKSKLPGWYTFFELPDDILGQYERGEINFQVEQQLDDSGLLVAIYRPTKVEADDAQS